MIGMSWLVEWAIQAIDLKYILFELKFIYLLDIC